MGIVIATKVGRHTGLIARQTDAYVEVIRLTNRGLDTVRLTEEQLIADWGQLTAYTSSGGVQRFIKLAQTCRTTKRVRDLLLRLEREYPPETA